MPIFMVNETDLTHNNKIMKTKITILLLLVISVIRGQNISTVTGNGTLGYSGDGSAGTSASLNRPKGISLNGGAVYIADYGNNRIRKMVISTGVISTVAGNGTSGFLGDGAAATSARLNHPSGIYTDASGNLYIADSDNNRIRKVLASGIISTIAGNSMGYSGDGGAATSAQLWNPTGLHVNSSGDVFIADANNNRIRKITASTGIISTIAGGGSSLGDGGLATNAQLSNPVGVWVDVSGNVYIADLGNYRVRKITASTGIITTIAGDGTANFSNDGVLATSTAIDPSGISADVSGNIYIVSTGGSRIRKITVSTGIINTIAGNGTLGFSGDGGVAKNAQINTNGSGIWALNGDVLIPDTENNRIRYTCTSLSPIITQGDSITFCQGSNIVLTSPSTGNWFKNSVYFAGSSQSCAVITAGSYQILVSSSLFACYAISDPIIVSMAPLPTASIVPTGTTTFCQGGTVTLNANIGPGLSYQWQYNGTNISTATSSTYSTGISGNYGVIITNTSSCTKTDVINVHVNNNPTVTAISTNTLICVGSSITLTGNGASTYSWTNGVSDNVAFTPSSTVTYTVTGTNVNGCMDSDTITVQVNTCTGINEITNNNALIIYPNPANTYLNLNGIDKKLSTVLLINMFGEVIRTIETDNKEFISINVENLSSGVYFIKVNDKCTKFIKE